jgi:hypothetical protein
MQEDMVSGEGAGTALTRPVRRPPSAATYIALVALAAALALVIASSYRGSFAGADDACCMSEWLINYNGGFVRRGLGGSLILWIAGASNSSPRALIFAILAVCYTLFYASLAVLILRVRKIGYLELLLAISPFAALFPVLHHVALQRKEVLMLSLAAIAGVTNLGRLDSVMKYMAWSLLFAVIVAIHDGSIFFLPLFVIYLRVVTPPAHPMGYRGLALLIPAAAVFSLSYLQSSRADTAAICAAMDAAAPGNWCGTGSAVSWLHSSALDGVRSVIGGYTRSLMVFASLTLLPGVAGLIPVTIALRKHTTVLRRAVSDLPFRGLFVWFALFAFAVVFAVAEDGNRWFYIATMFLTLMDFVARAEGYR